MNYQKFLETKTQLVPDSGFPFEGDYGELFPFQRHILDLSCVRGRSAVFADCGLGKTPIQLKWADAVVEHSGRPVLIFAPLAVAAQTEREGDKFGVEVTICREQADTTSGVNIANYEMLSHFDPYKFSGIVLDESSILKNFGGKRRKEITAFAASIPYRLCCTATPAPNDQLEVTNHSHFLGVMSTLETKGLFFIQDGNTTHKYKLKGHAERDYWAWMSQWAVACRTPSDLGFENDGFILPELNKTQHTVGGHVTDGWLFGVEAHTMSERRQARKESTDKRVAICADLVNTTTEPFLVWCDTNEESAKLTKAIPDAVEVAGATQDDARVDRMMGFSEGRYRVIVTKPSIAGFGMNWQHCANMAFVGLSDSFERMYQAIRRCWRFGQTKPVDVHVICADTEGAVVANIERKEREAAHMMAELVSHMHVEYKRQKDDDRYEGTQQATAPAWLNGGGNHDEENAECEDAKELHSNETGNPRRVCAL